MGGRGSGGRRIGSGRKPKDAHLRAIQGGLSRRPAAPPLATEPPAATAPAATGIEAPVDMTAEELVVWTREAPLALAARTLTPATVGAFRELCELEALKNQMLAKIKKSLVTIEVGENAVIEKANPLLTHYRGAVQRLATFRKDFQLAPFGKPMFAAEPEAPASQAQQKRVYW